MALSVVDRMNKEATPEFVVQLKKTMAEESKLPETPVVFIGHNHYLVAVRQCIEHDLCVQKMYLNCNLSCVDHAKIQTVYMLKNILESYL